MSWVRFVLCIYFLAMNLSCSVNILETFANKTTNEALYNDAQTLMNDGDYSGALTKIAAMTGAYSSLEKVIYLKATAYGGICGLNFLTFVQNFAAIGATRLFPFFLSSFQSSSSAKIDACITAQNLLTGIGAVGVRSNDENTLLMMLAFAKIGNITAFYADSAPVDGVADAAYDVCAVGGARTAGAAITDNDARELGTGITLAMEALAAIASTVNLGSGSLTALSGLCTLLGAGGANFCSKTDPTTFSAIEVKGIRTLFKESTVVGLGTCTGDITVCNCLGWFGGGLGGLPAIGLGLEHVDDVG